MNKQEIIQKTIEYVRKELGGESTGHDWWHIYRVWKLASYLAELEGNCDFFIVQMSALLHDIGDPKFYNGDTTVAPRLIGALLDKVNVSTEDKENILYIIANMSYSKSLSGGLDRKNINKSKEFMVVQDADRLDAIGAIGISRTFAYGGSKQRLIHDPEDKSREHMTAAEYHGSYKGTSINHFYEKLLLLKHQMNTAAGRKIAEQRHLFMELFLEHFYDEWEGRYNL